jgi:hypothetical protein
MITSLEFEDVKTINVNGTDYEVYYMKKEDTTSAYGFNITQPSDVYYQKSDLGMVKMDQTTTFLGIDSSSVTTFAPPKKDCKFPLSVGQSWTETFTEISYSSMDDEILFYNEETKTNTYTVLLQEEVIVEAGTFDAYKIQCDDGSAGATYSWYVPEVKNFVKMSAGGNTYELTSYEVTAPKTSGDGDGTEIGEEGGFDLFTMPYLLFLILIPIIVVVLAVGLVARGRKKKRTQAQVASQPTVDFTVQSVYDTQPVGGYAMAQQPVQPQRTAPVKPVAQRAAPKQAAQRPAPQRTQAARPPPKAAPAKRPAPKQAQTQPTRPPAHPRPTPKTQPVAATPPRQAPPPKQQQPPPPPPPPPTPSYPCPTCMQPLDLIKQYNRWYCRNCKKYP